MQSVKVKNAKPSFWRVRKASILANDTRKVSVMPNSVFQRLFVFLVCSFVLAGCATGSGSISLRDPSLNTATARISLLPPRYALGVPNGIVIGAERKFSGIIFSTLTDRTNSQWVSPDDAVSKIQDANVLPEYEALLDGYQKTGIPSRDRLIKISNAVGTPYIALCTINYYVSGTTATTGYRVASLTLQLISAQSGQVVLEISGKGDCGSGGYDIGEDKILQRAANEAINYYPDVRPSKH
jgi:hypothetical protein